MSDTSKSTAREPTPRPWKLDVRVGCVAIYDGPDRNCLASSPEAFIHYKRGTKDEKDDWQVREIDVANAARIVHCVNMHDGLVAAMRGSLKAVRDLRAYLDGPGVSTGQLDDKIVQTDRTIGLVNTMLGYALAGEPTP